jgi:hypothetical protein
MAYPSGGVAASARAGVRLTLFPASVPPYLSIRRLRIEPPALAGLAYVRH